MVEVKYINDEGMPVEDDEISRVFLEHQIDGVVVLSVETKTKYPKPELYHGYGVRFRTKNGNHADLTIQGIHMPTPIVMAEAGRYSLNVVVFNDQDNAVQVY